MSRSVGPGRIDKAHFEVGALLQLHGSKKRSRIGNVRHHALVVVVLAAILSDKGDDRLFGLQAQQEQIRVIAASGRGLRLASNGQRPETGCGRIRQPPPRMLNQFGTGMGVRRSERDNLFRHDGPSSSIKSA